MAKTYIDTVKYLIYTNVEIAGVVEKPDVVGAIFGQTEGLLGDELDLRDLQKNGRIGRIEVDLSAVEGRTSGVIKIPSSLDMVETCIIAAALETVDRVGPCEARLKITKVEDTRNMKRKVLVDRAKYLLKSLLRTEIPESKEISDMVRDEVKTAEVVEYGPERLSAGPAVEKSNEVIFVEGRADVINLLKNDITNVVAIGGAKVPRTIVELSKRKEVTVFLDGDRGGDIILNELSQNNADIDFISRAPAGIEVEELTRKEIIKYLRNKVPFEQGAKGRAGPERRRQEVPKFRQEYQADAPADMPREVPARESFREAPAREPAPREQPAREYREPFLREAPAREAPSPLRERRADVPDIMTEAPAEKPVVAAPPPLVKVDREGLMKELDELGNTLRARFYNSNLERMNEVPVRDVIKALGEAKDVHAIVFDGIITQRLVDLASRQGVKMLVGVKIGNVNKTPENIEIITKGK